MKIFKIRGIFQEYFLIKDADQCKANVAKVAQ